MPSIPEQQQSRAPSDGAGTNEAAGAGAARSSAGSVADAQPTYGASEHTGLGPAEHGSSAGGWVLCATFSTAFARITLCKASAVLGVPQSGMPRCCSVS